MGRFARDQELLATDTAAEDQPTEQPRRAGRRAALLLLLTTLLVGGSIHLALMKGSLSLAGAGVVGLFSLEAAAGSTASAGAYFVEQPMSASPGTAGLNMSIRMVGLEHEGVHVSGHLVKVENPLGRVSVGLPPGGCGTREKTSVTAQQHNPKCRLAVNAGYFNVTDGACIGNLVVDGTVIQSVPLAESNVNFGIRDGKFAIGYFTPGELQGFQQLISGVTWLVRDGKNNVQQGWDEANITVQTSGDKYVTNLASRTAAGVDAAGRLIIMQVDGSIAVGHNKRGLHMYEMADVMIDHGAVHAINLDGGGSSAMVEDGVLINYPSDNQPPSCYATGKYQCERPVSTILCVHEDEGVGGMLMVHAGTTIIATGSFLAGAACIGMAVAVALWQNLVPASLKVEDSDTGAETDEKSFA